MELYKGELILTWRKTMLNTMKMNETCCSPVFTSCVTLYGKSAHAVWMIVKFETCACSAVLFIVWEISWHRTYFFDASFVVHNLIGHLAMDVLWVEAQMFKFLFYFLVRCRDQFWLFTILFSCIILAKIDKN